MGQKVHPYGFRIGVSKTWQSRWYGRGADYAKMLHEDLKVRRFLDNYKTLQGADVASVEYIREPQSFIVILRTSRPGIVIGSKGANIEALTADLKKLTGQKVQVKVQEIKNPDSNARLVALNIAKQLRGRVAFKRALKSAVANAMKDKGTFGIKVRISGRLGGADMTRIVEQKGGRIPLQTLRANIDYAYAPSNTTYGVIGVKVWIYKQDEVEAEPSQTASSYELKQ